MGTANIPDAVDGDPIPATDHNSLRDALLVDVVPRNSSGNATSEAGRIGTPTYPFKSAQITSGYFVCGDIKMFHDFNAAVTPGQGWMKCNGDIINQANYDAIHGAGSWAAYVVSSTLDGKYTPNFTSRYPVGKATTPQTGGSAITAVGNVSHTTTLPNHTHSTPSHNHKWSTSSGNSVVSNTTFDSSGNAANYSANGVDSKSTGANGISQETNVLVAGNAYTNNSSGTTGNPSAANIDVQPESIEVQYWIRIVN